MLTFQTFRHLSTRLDLVGFSLIRSDFVVRLEPRPEGF
jgi:hypothetical protein